MPARPGVGAPGLHPNRSTPRARAMPPKAVVSRDCLGVGKREREGGGGGIPRLSGGVAHDRRAGQFPRPTVRRASHRVAHRRETARRRTPAGPPSKPAFRVARSVRRAAVEHRPRARGPAGSPRQTAGRGASSRSPPSNQSRAREREIERERERKEREREKRERERGYGSHHHLRCGPPKEWRGSRTIATRRVPACPRRRAAGGGPAALRVHPRPGPQRTLSFLP